MDMRLCSLSRHQGVLTELLEVALRDQALNISLANIELRVLGEIDRPGISN
jgi:hypothetical protein